MEAYLLFGEDMPQPLKDEAHAMRVFSTLIEDENEYARHLMTSRLLVWELTSTVSGYPTKIART